MHDLFVEVLDPAENRPLPLGERGEIAVSGGRNPFLPLLRYRTGDYARLERRNGKTQLLDLEARPPVCLLDDAGRLVNTIDVSRALGALQPLFGRGRRLCIEALEKTRAIGTQAPAVQQRYPAPGCLRQPVRSRRVSPIETTAAAFGLASVRLTVRRDIWCWPTGLVMVALYILIFYEAKLYSDMGLQVVYVVMRVYGSHHWLRGGPCHDDDLPVSGLSRNARLAWAVTALAGTGPPPGPMPPCPTRTPSSPRCPWSPNG